MKRKMLIGAALVCCFVLSLAAVAAGISGKWTGSVKTPDGNVYPVTYTFHVDGDKLSGTLQAEGSPKTIVDGKLNGDEFTFNITDDDGSTISHSGKYFAQGDSIAMNVVYQGSNIHTTLKRADDSKQ